MENILLAAIITGLTSGGLSCASVQGGLIASAVSDSKSKYRATTYFLASKLIIYTLLGGLLGVIGQTINISSRFQGIFQIFIGLFMLATAGRLLNLHPVFRFTVIKPPLFLLRFMRKYSKEDDNFLTPIILGLSTVFIPCGVTQAMLILSIGSGSFLNGSLIMLFFTLGTMPVFYLIGLSAEKIFKSIVLTRIAALTIAVVGLISINNGQILRGSVHTFQNYKRAIFADKQNGDFANIKNGVQEVTITVTNNGYFTNVSKLKANIPVRLKLISKKVQSCARSFVIPSFGINKLLPANGEEVIEFTPTKSELLTFSCGMGMYTGTFNIVE